MRFRSLMVSAAGLALAANGAAAQTQGAVELNGFASYTKLHKSRSLQDDLHGGGGRLGFFLTNRLELEGELDYAKVNLNAGGSETYMPIAARLNYNIPFSTMGYSSFFLGAGAVRSSYAGLHDYGPSAIAGIRLGAHRIALRADVSDAYLTSPKTNEVKGTVGLSVFLGGRSPITIPVVVSLSPASATLQPGQTQTLTASAMQGEKMLDRVFTCTTSDATIATVDANRVVTAVAPGTATITCTTGMMSATSTITVVAPPPPPAPPAPVAIDSSAILRARQDSIDAANAARNRSLMIFFDFDKSNIRPDAKPILDSLIAKAKAASGAVTVMIEGHTDSRGSDEYNLALGQRRANAAKRYMVANGVPSSKISIRSFGEECPAVPNATTEDEMQQNRRDEFVVTIGGGTAMQSSTSAMAKSCSAGSNK